MKKTEKDKIAFFYNLMTKKCFKHERQTYEELKLSAYIENLLKYDVKPCKIETDDSGTKIYFVPFKNANERLIILNSLNSILENGSIDKKMIEKI